MIVKINIDIGKHQYKNLLNPLSEKDLGQCRKSPYLTKRVFQIDTWNVDIKPKIIITTIRKSKYLLSQIFLKLQVQKYRLATDPNRTGDLGFTKPLLYQLSYGGGYTLIGFYLILCPKEPKETIQPEQPIQS